MKRVFLITCLACLGFLKSTNASANIPAPTIILKGKLTVNGQVRMPLVEAYLNDTSVEVLFNFDLGSLTIDVINEKGDSAFLTTVNAVVGSTLNIDTSGWESGEYILVIMDGQGGYLEGNFLID